MTLREKMRRLCKSEWSSMMIENSYRQGKEHRLHESLSDDGFPIRLVMDASQIWLRTPQGHRYWSDIADNLRHDD